MLFPVSETGLIFRLIFLKYSGSVHFYRKYLLELLCIEDKPENILVIYKTNNAAQYDSAQTFTQILEKRLIIKTAVIRIKSNIHKLEWIPSSS